MDIGAYSKSMELALKSGRPLMCTYCGDETLCLNSRGFCSNCEMPVYLDRDSFREKQPSTFQIAVQFADNVNKGLLDEAAKNCDALSQASKDPAYLYEKGLILIKQSNKEVTLISYDRSGFMEENTAHRNNAARFASAARAALIGAIGGEASMPSGTKPAAAAAFVSFLSHIKLSNIREATSLQSTIEKIDPDYYGAYSKMMLELNLGHSDAALECAHKMLVKGSFSINALFYAALALLDKRNYGDAKRIGTMLKGHVPDNAIDLLMKEIAAGSTI